MFNSAHLLTLSHIRRRRGEDIAQAELEKIQRAIQRFTVRRTKTMLNRMIEGNPEAFRNKHGIPCRYPKHVTDVYICDRNTATANKDRQLAVQIRETAAQLKGIQYVQKPIEVPDFYGGTHEQYLENRLSSAAALAMYYVMASLRSSRVRLIELIRGTEFAKTWGKISTRVKAQETGNVISRLEVLLTPLRSTANAATDVGVNFEDMTDQPIG